MSINCTSTATLPPANLTWYINQKLVGLEIGSWENLFSGLHRFNGSGLLNHCNLVDFTDLEGFLMRKFCLGSGASNPNLCGDQHQLRGSEPTDKEPWAVAHHHTT